MACLTALRRTPPCSCQWLITPVAVQVGKPAEEDLASWGHHTSGSTVPDRIMQLVHSEHPTAVSFVFTNQVR